jgi:hypothetical protein
MNFEYSDVKNLRWGNEAETEVLCDILFVDHPLLSKNQYVTFCAMESDVHGHGQELYKKALAGDFGKIGPYVIPEAPKPLVIDPVEKLKTFLSKNPDVAALLKGDSK